jgi:hypothetical protein
MATAHHLTDVQPSGFFTRALADADPAIAKAIHEELTASRPRSSL